MTKTSTTRLASHQAPEAAGETAEASRRPTHYVYAVRPSTKQGGKGFWTRIGAAWANRDGEGFSIKLDLIPLDGADIVVRTPRDDREEGGAA